MFNGKDGGGYAYQGITKGMTLQIDKHVRIRNFIVGVLEILFVSNSQC